MNKKIITIYLFVCFVFITNAQRQFSPRGIVKCISTEYEKYLQAKFPKRASNQEFENWIAPKVEEIKRQLLTNKNINAVVTIPVVVHIIHNGDALGQNENISDARILSQITVLNQDFRKMIGTPGHNTNPVGADVEMQFCMAQRTPNNVTTNGINRINHGITQWVNYNDVETMKTQTGWDSTKYFNIWVVNFSTNTNDEMGGVLGYAQFPSNSGLQGLNANEGVASTDGVVVDWRAFGTSSIAPGTYFQNIDKGRTATHEIGHCFGLRHTWGDNENEGDCSFDDFCADTPNCTDPYYASVSNPTPPFQCGFTRQIENYMDYSEDALMNIFTLNQKARVLAVLQNSPRRNTLPTSNACQTLSNEEFELEDSYFIYPNPANNFINVGLSNKNEIPDKYFIYNSLGQIVKESNFNSINDLNIDISNFSDGFYLLKIQKENSFKTLNFVKK